MIRRINRAMGNKTRSCRKKLIKPVVKSDIKPANYAGGRPTLYRPEYCQHIVEYFNVPEVKTEKVIVLNKKTGETEERTIAVNLPTLAGFCCKLEINRDTLHEWSKVHKDFSEAIKKAKQHQERILVSNGLNGLYNTAFAIFTAKNLIGWSDRQEITGKDGKDLLPPIEPNPMDLARWIAFTLSSAKEKT